MKFFVISKTMNLSNTYFNFLQLRNAKVMIDFEKQAQDGKMAKDYRKVGNINHWLGFHSDTYSALRTHAR